MLTVGGADSESLDAYVEVMKKLDFPYTVLSPGEFRHCYPMFQYSSDYGAMLDRAAGMLRGGCMPQGIMGNLICFPCHTLPCLFEAVKLQINTPSRFEY